MRSTLEAGGAGPYPARRALEMSGGEAASFCALRARAAGWPQLRGLTCLVRAEQGLAVVAAEQEGEPVQVLAQLAGVVGGVADELPQGGAEAPPGRGPAIR